MLKSSHKGFAENLLFALNIFIIFLLLFNDKISIPQWLQPVGRLHPLILHFPIVLLVIAIALEFFRFNERFRNEKLYQDLLSTIWLACALFAAITALMGLFLSKEPGYEGATLQWHKYLGVSVVFVSTFIYWFRTTKWYNSIFAKSGAVLLLVCLVIAGDYGADLTHGANFVLAPVWHPEKEKVPIDKALVFKDVVQPVFENKCISCHNPDKIKGGLMLIDEKSVLKGGRDGKIFIAGQPQLSLLLQRIHLPEGEEKHMPPSGKPQLTANEMNLLYLWIKGNAGFKEKVTDLPANDSLRMVAATFLHSSDEAEEKFDFAAADDKVIKKLNNNYRVIYPVAQGSPALGVNIYNKKTYGTKVLEELSPIKTQIISLDLNKMPVKDADLKIIAHFENLRTLILNFSEITGNTLNELAKLKNLRTLSLSGTKLNQQVLNEISSIKSLTKVTLWDTGLPRDAIANLQKKNKNVEYVTGFKDNGKPEKLNNPQIKNTSFVLSAPVPLQLSHPIKGVDIRYTTDGTDPDSITSPLYKPGTMISQNTAIKAKAFKAGWLGSDVVQFSFYKSTYTPDSVAFISGPNEKYSGDGAKTLIDKDLGGYNFGNGKWIASQKDLIVFMQFKTPVDLRTVSLNCMRNTGSQIFLPTDIEVWGGTDAAHVKLLGTIKTTAPKKEDGFLVQGMECKLANPKPVSCLKIVAKPLQKLPPWDPVKNQPGWVFMDEIFLN